ncbi:MBL fold metallo-hydrolase [Crossiella sp. SN42]|uniref:MBL fold metallo-hydrolase n=1 Tax=Crossiella sp. SN42 TaxID=2944808 RepID=UPI00207C60F6|nr:MBL fold metallo-hydrolase [Crossiella sp. SN42]MCO1578514.1 MBL fold metallo-hydrolase [Crossiella sp. SN42]
MCLDCTDTSTLGRRSLLRGALAGTAGAALTAAAVTTPAAAADSAPAFGRWRSAGVRFRWLGVAGWELTFDNRRVLLDPYLSRFRHTGPDGNVDLNTPLSNNPRNLAAVVDDPAPVELIMVTHSHWDHMADVPYLMNALHRKDKGTPKAVGTETNRLLLTAMGADPKRVGGLHGGEYLDFGGFTMRAFHSLHSIGASHQYFLPGTLVSTPPRPKTVGELVEGGTLAYRIDIADRLSVLFLGTGNFIETELAGQRPDVVVLSAAGNGGTYQFVERALTTLGKPRFVIPSHHDKMDTPLGQPDIDPRLLPEFRAAVARVSPRSTVIEPAGHLTPFTL